MSVAPTAPEPELSPCTSCGACCSYSADWPRFTIESDETLDRIPPDFVNERQSGMRCNGTRCVALAGTIGVATSCSIYDVRPEVCRECQPGDDACTMAREARGMPPIEVGSLTAYPVA
jgi:Fe-S-cluster containining protein